MKSRTVNLSTVKRFSQSEIADNVIASFEKCHSVNDFSQKQPAHFPAVLNPFALYFKGKKK